MNKLTFTMEEFQEAEEMQSGFCLDCGWMQESCEPDARNYHCDECGADRVFGAQEVLLMGLVE